MSSNWNCSSLPCCSIASMWCQGKVECTAACLQVEIKPDMVGHYLAEFSISYKPVKHGKPGIGATHSSRFIPLK